MDMMPAQSQRKRFGRCCGRRLRAAAVRCWGEIKTGNKIGTQTRTGIRREEEKVEEEEEEEDFKQVCNGG